MTKTALCTGRFAYALFPGNMPLGNDFTIAARAMFTAVKEGCGNYTFGAVSIGEGALTRLELGLSINSETLQAYAVCLTWPDGQSAFVHYVNALVASSRWVRIVAVKRGAKVSVLLDGKTLQTLDLAAPLDTASGFRVGQVQGCQPEPRSRYYVSDVQIWNRALEDSELCCLTPDQAAASTSGLLASWTFDRALNCGVDATGNYGPGVLSGRSRIVQIIDDARDAAASGPNSARPLLQLDPDGSPTLLKYQLPESTSYRGRNVISLNFGPEYFIYRPQPAPATSPAPATATATTQNSAGAIPSTGEKRSTVTPLLGPGPGPKNAPALSFVTVPRTGDEYRGDFDAAGLPTRRQQPYTDLSKDSPDIAQFTQALVVAKATGFLDPQLFPLMESSADAGDLEGAKHCLADVPVEQFAYVLALKTHDLAVYKDNAGLYRYRLSKKRVVQSPRPRLLLIEQYRLSSYLGQYGAGRTIKTVSLLPGERTTVYIKSYRATKETSHRASSIIDSTTVEAEREFQQTALQEQTSQQNIDSSFEYHAQLSATGNASWGWGDASVSVSGGVSGTTTEARELFAKNMSNAVQQHTDRASSYREVTVSTEFERITEMTEEQGIERQFENINVSRTLNFAFRQMNQEYITVLHLTDVRVAYFNGYRESRDEVALHELDRLLNSYVVQDKWDAVRTEIVKAVQAITNHAGVAPADFIQVAGDKMRVNRSFQSFVRGSDGLGAELSLPGVAIDVATHIMRTDAVVVDSFLGQGEALDSYSHGLQIEAIRREQLGNERRALELEVMREALVLSRARAPADQTQLLGSLLQALAPNAGAPAAATGKPAPAAALPASTTLARA